jgi:hypothetical protein
MRAERRLLLAALALAAGLAGCSKPRPVTEIIESNGGRWRVLVAPPLGTCVGGEPCSLEVSVETRDGEPPPRLELSVDAAMPDHRHGLVARPAVTRLGESRWRVDGLLLHMPGYWEVYFDLTEGAMTERAQAAVQR